MEELKFKNYTLKQDRPKPYKLSENMIKNKYRSSSSTPITQGTDAHKTKADFKSRRQQNSQNFSFDKLIKETGLDLLTDELSKKFFQTFIKLFTEECEKPQNKIQNVLSMDNKIGQKLKILQNKDEIIKNPPNLNIIIGKPGKQRSDEKIILKKFKINHSKEKEIEKDYGEERLQMQINFSSSIDRQIKKKDESVETSIKEFNSKLELKKDSSSTKSSQDETRINFGILKENLKDVLIVPIEKIVNEMEMEIDTQQFQDNMSFLSMEISQVENFSFIQRRSTDSKKIQRYNSKETFVLTQLKDNEKFLTFAASKQNSIIDNEITKQTSIAESLINHELKTYNESLNLVEYLMLDDTITSMSDVSLDSINTCSINTDFSE